MESTHALPGEDGMSLADKVFTVLKQEILSLGIKPREYLVIREVAARYGISPTPVREAFIRLEREGWLRIDGRRGAQVLLPSSQTLLDIVETEAVLEAHAASRAAANATPDQLHALAEILAAADAALEAGQHDRCRDLGDQFHGQLYAIAGNRYLRDIILALEEQIMRIRTLLWNVDEAPVVDSARQHHEILEALQRHDPEGAHRAMYHHTMWYEKNWSLPWNLCETPMQKTPLRVARTLWAGLFPLYWMEALGLLPTGFEIVDVAEYDQTLELLSTGEIDGNFQSLADVLLMAGRGVELRLLMASDLSVGVDGVVCQPHIRTIQELAGKRLGLSLFSYPHVLIEQVLSAQGLTEADVELVDLRGERVPEALARGTIDAGHTWGAHIPEAIAQGAHLLFTSAAFPGLLVDCLVAPPATVAQNLDRWTALVHAHEQATAWGLQHPAEGLAVVAERSGLPLPTVHSMLDGFTLFTADTARPLFDRHAQQPPALFASGRLLANFYLAKNLLTSAPDLDRILDPLGFDHAPANRSAEAALPPSLEIPFKGGSPI